MRDARLRSMIVEINPNLAAHRALIAELVALGFRWDEAQVAAARRSGGAFEDVAEYVFVR